MKNLCGTTLVPAKSRHSKGAVTGANPAQSTAPGGRFFALHGGDKPADYACCLAPYGSSLEARFRCFCPRNGVGDMKRELLFLGGVVIPAELQVQSGKAAGGGVPGGMLGGSLGGGIVGGAHHGL